MYYELTKTDLAALKKGDRIHVHKNTGRFPQQGAVCVVKEKERNSSDPFAEDVTFMLPAPVYVNGQRHKAEGEIKGQHFASIQLYKHSCTEATSVFATLKVGDEIAFEFFPDMLSNGYTAAAGIHVDVLRLIVHRKGAKMVHGYTLEVSACPDNSARMSQGIPFSGFLKESYEKGRPAA